MTNRHLKLIMTNAKPSIPFCPHSPIVNPGFHYQICSLTCIGTHILYLPSYFRGIEPALTESSHYSWVLYPILCPLLKGNIYYLVGPSYLQYLHPWIQRLVKSMDTEPVVMKDQLRDLSSHRCYYPQVIIEPVPLRILRDDCISLSSVFTR